MERFETDSLALTHGQRIRARVLSHHPWGVTVQIVGHEQVGASVDMIEQFGRTTSSHEELLAMFPPIGTEIDALVRRRDQYVSDTGVHHYFGLGNLRDADTRCPRTTCCAATHGFLCVFA